MASLVSAVPNSPNDATFSSQCVPVLFEPMHYEIIRSVTDKSLYIIFAEGTFGILPDLVRRLGPWRGLIGGNIISLKPHYRLQLTEQGFVLVYQKLANFSAEK
jgi:hypothetical protein